MCEENAVEKLMTFNFAGIAEEVEDSLSFKARNVDPRVQPLYSRILYSWYVFRGDYRNGKHCHLSRLYSYLSPASSTAALTMYQRARKLRDLTDDPSLLMSLAEEQLEAYFLAMNSLSLLDPKSAWIIMPVFSDNGREVCLLIQQYPRYLIQVKLRKRRKLTKHIPDIKYTEGTHDAEIVDLSDIQYDYALLSAQLELLRKDPSIPSASGQFRCQLCHYQLYRAH